MMLTSDICIMIPVRMIISQDGISLGATLNHLKKREREEDIGIVRMVVRVF